MNTMHGKRSVYICPRCNVRVLASPDNDDIEHECNSGNPVLDQEDIHVVGDWEDYTGSGSGKNANLQGVVNELQMTRPGIEGEDKDPNTDRGNNATTHRQRQHIEFIELE